MIKIKIKLKSVVQPCQIGILLGGGAGRFEKRSISSHVRVQNPNRSGVSATDDSDRFEQAFDQY